MQAEICFDFLYIAHLYVYNHFLQIIANINHIEYLLKFISYIWTEVLKSHGDPVAIYTCIYNS